MPTYVFFWGDTPEHLRWKDRRCEKLAGSRWASRGVRVFTSQHGWRMQPRRRWNSSAVRFLDNGELACVPTRALRRVHGS